MKIRYKAFWITALLILVSVTIYAFSILTNVMGVYRKYLQFADGGKQYIPFIYRISQDTPEEYAAGINAGAAVWTNVETAYWVFEEGERTSETRNKRDQTNLIFFDVDNSSGSFEEGTSTIAFSMTWSNISAQEGFHATESDMVWNARDYPPSADPNYCPPDQFDLQSIIAHELGHHLGLGHTGSHGSPPGIGELVPEATMYGYGYYGDTTKRSLHLQDIAGVSEIYPTWQLSGTVSDS